MIMISLSPVRTDASVSVSKKGEALTINGSAYDFSSLPEGATIPAGVVPCEWISGPVHRIGGNIHLTLILPLGPNPPQSMAFPSPIFAQIDGEIILPKEADNVEA